MSTVHVWISKYAATNRIIEADARQMTDSSLVSYAHGYYMLGRDAFLNYADAVANGEARKLAKLESLRRQIAKLEKKVIK